MKYYIIGHDFTFGVNETPSVVDYRTYKKDINAVGEFVAEEFDDGDTAINEFWKNYKQTHFEIEYWEDPECPGFTIYGWWYELVDDNGHLEDVSDGRITGHIIDEWKNDVERMMADGTTNKYFYWDCPHYTYCPEGW